MLMRAGTSLPCFCQAALCHAPAAKQARRTVTNLFMNLEQERLSMKTDTEMSLARSVAPEDLARDDFVCVLFEVSEFVSLAVILADTWQDPKPIRVAHYPCETGTPRRVIEICLPFVLLRDWQGKHELVDVRQVKLARVPQRFGRSVVKRLKREAEKAKSRDAAASVARTATD